jgi:enoyl-CoA hydratase/carnithine racemase
LQVDREHGRVTSMRSDTLQLNIESEPGGRPIAIVILDRPPVNAFSDRFKADFLALTAELAARPDIAALVVHGRLAFSAGDDIKEMAALPRAHALQGYERISDVCTALERLPMPVIAAVTGFALGGGCELALAADFRITAQNATWGLPEIALGLIPGGGGTQRLPRVIGPARAKRLIYTGRKLTGTEAVEWGLADEAVGDGEVLPTALSWARELAAQAPNALRAAKRALEGGLGIGLDAGLRLEAALFAGLFATSDAERGLNAFASGRTGPARFEGD